MSEDWAIKIDHLSKVYKIFDKPSDRVREALNPFGKRYSKDFYALNDVSLTIKKGETVGIIGKNGAGKSTLLKVITGVLTPTSGSIQVNGRIASLLELGAGFNPEMTGIENIYMNGTIMGYSREEMDARLQNIIDFADIGDFINQPVKMYSSGMFARLAFAVNAFVEPDILIVDEALSVGDAGFQAKCYRKFAELRKKGVTVLLVSHDITSILQFCDAGILLSDGKLLYEGNTRTAVDTYKKILSGIICNNDADLHNIGKKKRWHAEKDWKSHYKINDSMLEYGDKNIEIVDYKVSDENKNIISSINNRNSVTITLSIRAKKDIYEPIVAFSIKDIKGNELIGVNTLLENVKVGWIKAGIDYEFSFEQKIPLQPNRYTVSFGVTKYVNNGLHVYHRLYDALLIDIISNYKSAGLVSVNSNVSIKEVG